VKRRRKRVDLPLRNLLWRVYFKDHRNALFISVDRVIDNNLAIDTYIFRDILYHRGK